MWRGGVRKNISVAAPFVWRCLNSSTMAPSPHPAHRTGQADFPHPALGQDVTLSRATPSAASAFTRVTACTLALSPYIVTRTPEASTGQADFPHPALGQDFTLRVQRLLQLLNSYWS